MVYDKIWVIPELGIWNNVRDHSITTKIMDGLFDKVFEELPPEVMAIIREDLDNGEVE